MRLPLPLLMFAFLSRAIFGADIYLYSKDGKPIQGYEFSDLTTEWVHAKNLHASGVGYGYPVAHYRDPTRTSGYVYDFSKSPREIRASFRKANRVVNKGRYTIVYHTASWCGPCQAYKRSGELERIKKVADLEVIDIDDTNPFEVSSVPSLVVMSADNEEVARYTGQVTVEQIKELTP